MEMTSAAAMIANYNVTMFIARSADLYQTAYHSRIDGCLDTLISTPSTAYMTQFANRERDMLAERQFDRVML